MSDRDILVIRDISAKVVRDFNVSRPRAALTPAPDAAAVAWKKRALAGGDHEYTDVKTERIERVIADDLAFLAAHPVRQSNKAITHRGELAAVVATMPEADQQPTRTMVREILQDRDQ
jgi:hypothetical protein